MSRLLYRFEKYVIIYSDFLQNIFAPKLWFLYLHLVESTTYKHWEKIFEKNYSHKRVFIIKKLAHLRQDLFHVGTILNKISTKMSIDLRNGSSWMWKCF